MEIKFTNISKDDLLECAKLYVEVFRNPPWNEEWSLEEASERLSDMYNIPKPIAIKATHNGNLCGFLMGRLQKWTGETNCDIEEFCISNSMQRKRIGSLLMTQLEETLKIMKVSGVLLITQKNSVPFSFYSSLNFVEDSSLVVMRKKIK